jgi:transposase
MEQPQEAEDEEFERVWQRVAAVDVAKASGVVCTRVPGQEPGSRRRMHVWTVGATLGAVTELGDHLRCEGIEVVTLESTSDYWRIWHAVLEAAGLKVQLVNARAVKNVTGRAKTDRKDAVWLAKLTERGMLQPSFVPPMTSGGCGSTRGCGPVWSTTRPGTGSGWKSSWNAPWSSSPRSPPS